MLPLHTPLPNDITIKQMKRKKQQNWRKRAMNALPGIFHHIVYFWLHK